MAENSSDGRVRPGKNQAGEKDEHSRDGDTGAGRPKSHGVLQPSLHEQAGREDRHARDDCW